MVRFHADPEALIAALAGGSPPPLERSGPVILIAPGLPRFWRVASQAEAALWYRLPASDAPLSLCRRLFTEGAVIAGPSREDVPLDINEQLIVELYSK